MEENNKRQPEQDIQEPVNEEAKNRELRFVVLLLCFWQECIFVYRV